MEKKIRLELIGITYNQIESGVYALILRQEGGTRRIPIIIGFPEAQAIECKLQEIATPRPLTHDMTMSMLGAFGITVSEVLIRQLPNGVFAADITLTDGVSTHVIDARSSDAVAIAIRAGAPVFTTEEVLMKAGFDSNGDNGPSDDAAAGQTPKNVDELTHMTDEELREAMARAAGEEDYEEAARIKAELDRRGCK